MLNKKFFAYSIYIYIYKVRDLQTFQTVPNAFTYHYNNIYKIIEVDLRRLHLLLNQLVQMTLRYPY